MGRFFTTKSFFEQAGISEVPKTVTQLRNVDKLQAAGITPFAAGYGTEWTIGQYLGYGCSSILTRRRWSLEKITKRKLDV